MSVATPKKESKLVELKLKIMIDLTLSIFLGVASQVCLKRVSLIILYMYETKMGKPRYHILPYISYYIHLYIYISPYHDFLPLVFPVRMIIVMVNSVGSLTTT